MPQESQIAIAAADAALINHLAQQAGIAPGILIRIAAHALAEHIRQHGTLTLPVRIATAQTHCYHCDLHHPRPAAANIITAQFTS